MMKNIATLLLLFIVNVSVAQDKPETKLSTYLAQQEFSGAILLQGNESSPIVAANGYKDLESKTDINTEDRFKIASITKLFTAVLVMQLVDEGKLQLDDTVEEFLPTLGITNSKKIQITHLLQHTSGLQNESKLSYLNTLDPVASIQKFATKKALFKPGKSFNYNNIDYILLGLIIEEQTGKSYLENLETRILNPIGLENTGLLEQKDVDDLVVQAYELKKSGLQKEISIHIENFWAAGSMYSTLTDLLKFTKALKSEELLSDSAKEALFASSAELGYAALGCWTFNSPFIAGQPRVMERRGGILGSNAVIMTSLDGPETLIALSNTDQFNTDTFGDSSNMKEYLFQTLFNRKD